MTRSYPLGATGESRYYTHNQRNMVTQIQDVNTAGGADANRYFTYNGVGGRVVVVAGGAPNYWTYARGKPLTEKDNVGALVRRYRHNSMRQEAMLGSGLEIVEGAVTF